MGTVPETSGAGDKQRPARKQEQTANRGDHPDRTLTRQHERKETAAEKHNAGQKCPGCPMDETIGGSLQQPQPAGQDRKRVQTQVVRCGRPIREPLRAHDLS